jgi:hypothetical protein
LGERLNGIQEVMGSIPFSSTIKIKDLQRLVRGRLNFLQAAFLFTRAAIPVKSSS